MLFLEFRVFGAFVLLVLWFAFARKRMAIKIEKEKDKFWDREALSNSTRKQSLDDLAYIVIPLDTLPCLNTTDSKLREYQDLIKDFAGKKIVNLTGFTNTDLKLTYGAPNLPLLTAYDQNFTDLVRLLYAWGEKLHSLGFTKEAVTVLEFGAWCHTDISGHYKLLASLYKEEGHPEKIQNLISVAEGLNSLMKKSILQLLQDSLSTS